MNEAEKPDFLNENSVVVKNFMKKSNFGINSGSTFPSDLTHYEKMVDYFSYNIDASIYSARIFDVTINDLSTSPAVQATTEINFESTCTRLDFDQKLLKQIKRGANNGLDVILKLPKIYNGEVDFVLAGKTFPRRKLRLSNSEVSSINDVGNGTDTNAKTEQPEMKSDYYVMVYPNNVKFPTRESLEVSSFILQKDTHIEAAISYNKVNYIHDPLNKEKLCQNDVEPLDECLYNSIKCRPLSQNSTCDQNIENPIDPINPYNVENSTINCYPQNCHQSYISIEKNESQRYCSM